MICKFKYFFFTPSQKSTGRAKFYIGIFILFLSNEPQPYEGKQSIDNQKL